MRKTITGFRDESEASAFADGMEYDARDEDRRWGMDIEVHSPIDATGWSISFETNWNEGCRRSSGIPPMHDRLLARQPESTMPYVRGGMGA